MREPGVQAIANKTFNKTLIWGVGSVLAYNVLTAVQDVATGNVEQVVSPFLLVLISFSFSAILFQGIAFALDRRNYRLPFSHRKQLLQVNLQATGAWIGYFLGIKYLEPAVVAAILVGLGPVTALLVEVVTRAEKSVGRADLISTAGIFAGTVLLAAISITGRSSLVHLSPRQAWIGLAFTVVSAVFTVTTSYAMKGLSQAGCTPVTIMAHRFYVLVPASLGVVLAGGGDVRPLLREWPSVFMIALVIAGGLLAYQYGIKYAPTLLVIILSAVSPLIVYVFEMGDARLRLSVYSGLFIALTSLFALVPVFSMLTARGARPHSPELGIPLSDAEDTGPV